MEDKMKKILVLIIILLVIAILPNPVLAFIGMITVAAVGWTLLEVFGD